MTPDNHTENSALLAEKIRVQQVSLLYQQIPFALAGECVTAIFVTYCLWGVVNHYLLGGWLFFICFFSTFLRGLCIYLYRVKNELLTCKGWLRLYVLGVFFTGAGWGFTGVFLVLVHEMVYKILLAFVIFGITAAANPIYSALWGVYSLFLMLSITPFIFWAMNQGGLFAILGLAGFVYVGVMLNASFFNYKLFRASLRLRFKNIDLDIVQKVLEKKITERTKELKESLAITKSTLESTEDGILVSNLENEVIYFNQKFIEIWGASPLLMASKDDNSLIDFMKHQLTSSDQFVERIRYLYAHPEEESFDELLLKNGKVLDRYSSAHQLDNVIVGRVWSFRDVTERKIMEKKIVFQATHDALTELPNRVLLNDRLHEAIVQAKRTKKSLSVMFLDLDNFKYINDNMGHDAGDTLLKEFTVLLRKSMRESDTIARFGGDEFVVLCMVEDKEDVIKTAERIYNGISIPIKLGEVDALVTMSMGISIYPKDGLEPSQLLQYADMAMYKAKRLGRNTYQIYNKSIGLYTKKHLAIQSQLHSALEKNELYLVYQPIINLKTKKIVAVEALIRWRHPELGLILPEDFIHVAEDTGYIIQIGQWLLHQACKQTKEWQNQGLPAVQMSVNISGSQFLKNNFVDVISRALNETQLEAQFLELEFKENYVMKNTKNMGTKLAKLHELGVGIAIDDFGIGYLSFNYLKDFPIKKLKIDRTFVQECITNSGYSSMIRAIILMAHDLNFITLAEGIETQEQMDLMNELQCDEMQGYFYSQPKVPGEIATLLKNN